MIARMSAALCLAGLLAWAGASIADEPAPLAAPARVAPAGPVAVPSTAKASIDDYRLGMHDLIEISVFQVPEGLLPSVPPAPVVVLLRSQ